MTRPSSWIRLPALRADGLPAVAIPLAVAGDVLRRRLQREMRRIEGEIEEERLAAVLRRMLRQVLDAVVGDGGRRVVSGPGLDRRQLPVVLEVDARMEVAADVLEVVGAIEPVGQRHPVDVPLARVVRPIAERMEHLGQQLRPFGANALGRRSARPAPCRAGPAERSSP